VRRAACYPSPTLLLLLLLLQGFVRSTTKYWVRAEDVSNVKYHVLQVSNSSTAAGQQQHPCLPVTGFHCALLNSWSMPSTMCCR
jgi:hypothetical protein